MAKQPHDAIAPTDRVVNAIRKDRERFGAAVRSAAFYRLFWVKIKIIDGCNIRCVMCNHWRRDEYRRVFLTRERMFTLVDELAELGARHVNWSGGEPTIRRDLPDIIQRLTEAGIESSIITNGTLITDDYAERLLRARLSAAQYSLESAVPAIHNQVVGADDAFAKLFRGARALRSDPKHRPFLTTNTVLTSFNTGPELVDLVSLACELGISVINLSCVYTDHLNSSERGALPPTRDQVARFRNEYLPRMEELGEQLGVAVVTNASEQPPPDLVPASTLVKREHVMGYYQHPEHSCYLPFYHCTIDYNGNVSGCCHMREGDGLLGNIREARLQDVLHSEAATDLRRRLTTANMPEACGACAMQIRENNSIDGILNTAN